MRKIYALALWACCLWSLGAGLAKAAEWQLWQPIPEQDPRLAKLVSSYELYQLDNRSIQRLLNERPAQITIYYPGINQAVTLKAYSPWMNDPMVRDGQDQPLYAAQGLHYRGAIPGMEHGFLGLSVNQGFVMGMASLPQQGNQILGLYPSADGRPRLISYNDRNLLIKNNFDCQVKDTDDPALPNPQQAFARYAARATGLPDISGCRAMSEHLFISHRMFNQLGSVQRSIDYITGLFNVNAIIYQREGIRSTISQITVFDQPDSINYNFPNSSQVLQNFGQVLRRRQIRINGTFGHLVHNDSGSSRGVAAGFDLYCKKDSNVCYSSTSLRYGSFPTYSWAVNVTVHEIGHLMGSRHTHWCGWIQLNGTRAPVDSCFTPESFRGQGACFTRQRIRNNGYIMSYCHIGGQVDFSEGFGALSGARIVNAFANARCLTGRAMPRVRIAANGGFCKGFPFELINATDSTGRNTQVTKRWTLPDGSTATGDTLRRTLNKPMVGWYKYQWSDSTCFSNIDSLYVDTIGSCLQTVWRNYQPCGDTQLDVSFRPPAQTSILDKFYYVLSDGNGNFSPGQVIDSVEAPTTAFRTLRLPPLSRGLNYQLRIEYRSAGIIGSASASFSLAGNSSLAGNAPQANVSSICSGNSVTLSGSSTNGTPAWFASPRNSFIGSGANFTINSVPRNASYAMGVVESQIDSVGAKDTVATGQWLNPPSELTLIELFRPATIQQFAFYVRGANSGQLRVDILTPFSLTNVGRATASMNFFGERWLNLVFQTQPTLSPGRYWLRITGNNLAGGQVYGDSSLASGGIKTEEANLAGVARWIGEVDALGNNSPGTFNGLSRIKLRYFNCPGALQPVPLTVFSTPGTPNLRLNAARDSVQTDSTASLYEWSVDGNLLAPSTNRKVAASLGTSFSLVLANPNSNGFCRSQVTSFVITDVKGGTLKAAPLSVYPNPANEVLHIAGLRTKSFVQLIDAMGRNLGTQTLDSEHDQLNISNLPMGIYTVLIDTSVGKYAIRWQKQ